MNRIFPSAIAAVFVFSGISADCLAAPESSPKPIDLSGAWQLRLDPEDKGIDENWQKLKKFPAPAKPDPSLAGTVNLPGSIQAQGFGVKPTLDGPWTGHGWKHREMFPEGQSPENFKIPFMLQPPRLYVGPAWYRRQIEVPTDWKGTHARLFLERVHWQTTAWLDGKKIGFQNSLGTPHVFDLGEIPPGHHTLTLRIDNRLEPVNPGPLSHSVTDATQGNWNGAIGKLELRPLPLLQIEAIEVRPDASGKIVDVRVRTKGRRDLAMSNVTAMIYPHGKSKAIVTKHSPARPEVEFFLELPDVRRWDEFSPTLYDLVVRLDAVSTIPDPTGKAPDLVRLRQSERRTFGFRKLGSKDGRITVNGRKTFLRGTLECCIFPLTGHPPMDIKPWRRMFRIAKAHGLNHMRFHSWCPPEAAFAAADEAGFYLEPEVSSWANQGAKIGDGLPLDAWLEAETGRMIRAYGHHPSFAMLAYGNEPSGKNKSKWLQEWVARWKKRDPFRLYTTGCGWPIMPGSDWYSSPRPRIQGWGQGLASIINSQPPGTDFDWSDFVKKHSDAPVISHEIGQWCVYPNFDEIKKYTGYFKARNFELFRDQAKRNGVLPQAHDFLMASGRLQLLAYKHDIEAALRTPNFGGFQLLALQDFPGQGTALVGVLDAFWDDKPYCTPAIYHKFCAPTVPLLRTKRFVLTKGEAIEAEAELAHFGAEDLKGIQAEWILSNEKGKKLAGGVFPKRDYATGDLHKLGHLTIPTNLLKKAGMPAHVMVTLRLPERNIENSWDFFVFTKSGNKTAAPESPKVKTTSDLDEALAALASGQSVLWLPDPSLIRNDPKRPLRAGFSPIFWNTAWTSFGPPHTLGILCDPTHPALAEFPTESHSNWQWWEIVTGSQPFIITELRDLKPIVQPIDDWFTNRKLGLVIEARVGKGKLIAAAADLSNNLDSRPAARQLRQSLLDYMATPAFAPKTSLNPEDLKNLVRKPLAIRRLGAKAKASSAEAGYPPSAAIDGNPNTLWHTAFSKSKPGPPHDFVISFPKPVALSAVLLTQRQDHNRNGQVKQVSILDENGKTIAQAKIPKNARDFPISLPKATRTAKLTIRIESSYAGPFASLAEVDVAE